MWPAGIGLDIPELKRVSTLPCIKNLKMKFEAVYIFLQFS